ASGVQAIAGPVSISASGVPSLVGTAPLTINLDDFTDLSSSASYSFENEAGSPGWGDVRGLAPGQINYQYEFTAALAINTDAATANVLETGVPTAIQGQSGTASPVQVGDGRGTQNILGALTIVGPSPLLGPNPAATITINDTGD